MQPYVGSVETQLSVLQAHYLLYSFISLTPPPPLQLLPLLLPPAATTAHCNCVEHHAVAHVPLRCRCRALLYPRLCLPSHPHPLPSTESSVSSSAKSSVYCSHDYFEFICFIESVFLANLLLKMMLTYVDGDIISKNQNRYNRE
jgi:hypothetical protein